MCRPSLNLTSNSGKPSCPPGRRKASPRRFYVAKFLCRCPYRLPAIKRPRRPLAEKNSDCCRKKQKFKIAIDFKNLFYLRATMAEERFMSACNLSSSSSFSISSADSTFSDDITDSSNSSWGFLPPPMSDGNGGPLFHMNSHRAGLPSCKRGLSNYFTGKSQSFTSLANVKCVEDLAKPEKKLKSSHSWESVMKSSYNNQTIRSSILSAGSAESMEMPRKASFGRKMSKKNSGLIPCRLLLSSPKQMT